MSRVGFFRVAVVVVWIVLVGVLVHDQFGPSRPSVEPPIYVSAGELPSGSEEAWMGVYMKEHKIGYTHHRFVPSQGGYRFEQESMLKTRILETDQTVRVTLEGETAEDYALRRFAGTLKGGVGNLTVRGTVDDSELVLHMDTAGERSTQRLPLKGPIYLANGARQALAQSELRPGLRFETQVFDPLMMQYQPLSATVEERDSVDIHGTRVDAWRVREEFRSLVSTIWVDDDGKVLREEGPLDLVMLRETAEQAVSAGWKGDEVPFDLIAALAVPVSERIPRPRETRRLEIRLGGIDGIDLPADARQSYEDGRLIVQREEQDTGGTFTLPYRGDAWRGDLEETPFLQVSHPRIREAAALATGGETDARRAAEAILEWVSARLDQVPTASIPNALQVLDMGEGDCNEHAVLYAALCRAIGLPARVVAGAVYINDVFLYHAWNEVWLGSAWVSVDATLNQLPADATHIKFVEGGPEEHGRMLKVIGQLSIDVLAAD